MSASVEDTARRPRTAAGAQTGTTASAVAPVINMVRAEVTHCEYLFRLYEKPVVMRAHGLKKPIPATDWRRIIQGVWDGWRDCWVVRKGLVAIGHIGLQDRSDLDRRAEVVVTIDPSYHRRGAGREALARIVDWCDREGLEVLIARVRADNDAARALLARFGFVEAGRVPRFYREAAGPVAQLLLVRLVEDVASATSLTSAVPAKKAATKKTPRRRR